MTLEVVLIALLTAEYLVWHRTVHHYCQWTPLIILCVARHSSVYTILLRRHGVTLSNALRSTHFHL